MVARLRKEYRITDPVLLIKAGGVLVLTVLLFVISGSLHMEPSIAALAGASLLLVISGVHIVEMVEKEVEWPTLVFFMMLFIVVAGAEQTGLIQIIADWVRDASGSSPVLAVLIVLWVSAILSAIIDNIPFTATMLPIVAYLTNSIPGHQPHGPVVGAVAGRLPRRQRHADRGQRQRGHRRHGGKGGLPDKLQPLPEGGAGSHADHGQPQPWCG